MATLSMVMMSFMLAGQASAHHEPKWVQGPSCGGRFVNQSDCSFRFQGGQLYVGASVRGAVDQPEGGATVRLEAVSRTTGQRRVLLSCVTPGAGACAAGGSYDFTEKLRRGQRLFCTVEGVGRGRYECGTMLKQER
ncbi:MAG: hypothetical protein M3164_00050 [Actinomycetota bacterium]|nr:hypothetical protein [Actinomycetota bacterium]